MLNNGRNITREPLGRMEARFLVKVATKPTFSMEEARHLFQKDLPPQFLDRLERKGWIRRIKRGRFAVIPLSSGEARTPQLHEFVIAMELVSPAAIAYWSALNHHGMTEQIPRTVFVATNHHVQLSSKEALGVAFKIISVRPKKFFGVVKDWINEQPFTITDKEKTIIDGLDLPKYVGGVGEIAKAFKQAWEELDEAKLREYAAKIGNSAVGKRLGYLMEALGLGDAEALRKAISIAPGFSPLDPTLPKRGKHNRRWGLLINVEVGAHFRKVGFERLSLLYSEASSKGCGMKTKEEVLKILRQEKPELARRYGVRRLALFGSYARGDQREDSDVDILVEVDPSIGLGFVELADRIEAALGIHVELVSDRAIKPRYWEVIKEEMIDVA